MPIQSKHFYSIITLHTPAYKDCIHTVISLKKLSLEILYSCFFALFMSIQKLLFVKNIFKRKSINVLSVGLSVMLQKAKM